VQLLEFLNLLRMHRKQPHAPSVAAPQGHWGMFPRSAVLPLATTLNSIPSSHAALLLAHRFESLLQVLTSKQAQRVLTDEHSAPSSHPVCPESGARAPAVNQLGAELRPEDQLKLSRWPWSLLGKEVRSQESA
jgi:hypothetical protein